jgi:hypothetical protein
MRIDPRMLRLISIIAFSHLLIASPLFGQSQWTLRDSSWTQEYFDVTWGDSQFVVVGEGGAILTSPDAITWTNRQSGVNLFLYSVAYAKGLFVAVGEAGTILSSSDGITWTAEVNTPTRSDLACVIYAKDQFVALGADDSVLVSADGLKWTRYETLNSLGLIKITYGNGLYVAIGAVALGEQSVATSVDGYSWTSHEYQVALPLTSYSSVAYGNGLYVVTRGEPAGILVSSDAVTWKTIFAPSDMSAITFANGQFVAFGVGTILTSADGSTWTTRAWPKGVIQQGLSSVAYGNGQFVAVGGFGIILSSPADNSKAAILLGTAMAGTAPIVTYSGHNLKVAIHGSDESCLRNVEVFDVDGRKLLSSGLSVVGNTVNILSGALSPGIHALRFSNETSHYSLPFAVSR